MMNEEQNTVPSVKLGFNDLQVIDDILRGLSSGLRNSITLSPPILKRIRELEELRRRVIFIRSKEGNAAYFTRDDLLAVREAMIIFVKTIRHIEPQSLERDETLDLVNKLRRHIEKGLF